MDNRKWSAAAAAAAPTAPASPSSGFPTDGNPSTATPATNPGAFWFHAIGEEIRNVIAAGGQTPTLGTLTQLLSALDARYAALSSNGLAQTGTVFVGDYSSSTANRSGSVVFPFAYATTCSHIDVTAEDPTGSASQISITARSSTGFSYNVNEPSAIVQNLTINWRAYGS